MKQQAIYSTEHAQGWLPWGAIAPFLAVVFVLLPSIVASLVLFRLRLVDKNGDPVGIKGYYVFLVLTFALIALVLLAWVRFVERRPFASIGLIRKDATKKFLGGLAVGLVMSSVLVSAIWLSGAARARGFGIAISTPIMILHIGLFLACFVFQSSVEEVVFRGWLLSAMSQKFNVPIAIVVTSLVFALMHFDPKAHWLFVVNVYLFSVFTCCWSIRSGNVWGVMGWHGAWNWLLGVGFETPISGFDLKLPALIVRLIPTGGPLFTGGAQGPEGSVFCTAFFVLGTALILWRATRASSRIDRAASSTN